MKYLKRILSHRTDLYFPRYSPLILLVIILLFAYSYNYDEVLSLRPQGPHQWRQCDCLSITSKLYLNESTFFQPEIYNLLIDNEGRTVSDFPIVYYLVSLIWKVFGKHEWMFRMLNFLVSIVGMLALLRVFERNIKDSFWSLFAVGILFTSGIYVYYSLNFLMNTTALNMVFIGWYFFFKFKQNSNKRYLYLTFLFFLIGGLLKMSSLISFIALCSIFFLEWIGVYQLQKQGPIFKNKFAFIIPASIVILIISLWVFYADAYNHRWNSNVFLIGILPIWELSGEEISSIIEHIRVLWLDEYFYRPIHYLLIIGLLSTWVFNKKSERTLQALTSLIVVGFISFMILFFSPLGQHDYYVIDLLILAVFIMLSFFNLVLKNKSKYRIIDLTIVKILAITFMILSVLHTADKQKQRLVGWRNEKHLTEYYGYASIEPYLDSIGIDWSSKVLSKDDFSINISLYLMNRQGWTGYGTDVKDSASVANRIERGAEYLLHHKEIDYESESFWSYFIESDMGQYKNVSIHKIGIPDRSGEGFK